MGQRRKNLTNQIRIPGMSPSNIDINDKRYPRSRRFDFYFRHIWTMVEATNEGKFPQGSRENKPSQRVV